MDCQRVHTDHDARVVHNLHSKCKRYQWLDRGPKSLRAVKPARILCLDCVQIAPIIMRLLGLLTDYNRPSLTVPGYTRGICRYKRASVPQSFTFSFSLDFSFLSFLACNALPTLLEFSRPTSLDIHIPMLATSFKSPGAV